MNKTQRQYDYMDGVVFFGSMIKQRSYINTYLHNPHNLSCKYSLAKEKKIYLYISDFIQNMDFSISRIEEQVVDQDFLSWDRQVFSPGLLSGF